MVFHRSLTVATMASTYSFGVTPFGGGLILDLLAVLVGARQEHDVIALHPLVACQCITGHGGVAVADVQLIAG